MARTTETLDVGGRPITLSNRNKVLWPRDGYTKGDLVEYYRLAAPYLLPQLKDNPLTLQRYPDGIDGPSFFEKQAPKFTPDWIPSVTVKSEFGRSSTVRFILCNDEATLVWVANLAAVVLHIWTSHVPTLDHPDFLFFDLDPGDGCTVATLAKVALALRDTVGEIGLVPLVKSSGGSGLHVGIPLAPNYDYEFCKGFAELVARTLHARMPKQTTLERSPAKRPKGTVYLDYVQVGKGKTLVPAFSPRARDGAPVSMPLDWEEVETLSRKRGGDPEGEFARFTLKNAPPLMAARAGFWGGKAWKRQKLEAALTKAQRLWR